MREFALLSSAVLGDSFREKAQDIINRADDGDIIFMPQALIPDVGMVSCMISDAHKKIELKPTQEHKSTASPLEHC